jgi:hypothetical protein
MAQSGEFFSSFHRIKISKKNSLPLVLFQESFLAPRNYFLGKKEKTFIHLHSSWHHSFPEKNRKIC